MGPRLREGDVTLLTLAISCIALAQAAVRRLATHRTVAQCQRSMGPRVREDDGAKFGELTVSADALQLQDAPAGDDLAGLIDAKVGAANRQFVQGSCAGRKCAQPSPISEICRP